MRSAAARRRNHRDVTAPCWTWPPVEATGRGMRSKAAALVGRQAELAGSWRRGFLSCHLRSRRRRPVTLVRNRSVAGKSAPHRRVVGVQAVLLDLGLVSASAGAGEPGWGVGGPGGCAAGAPLLRVRFALADLAPGPALARFRVGLQETFRRSPGLRDGDPARFSGFEMEESPLALALERRPGQERELARAVLGRFFEQDAAGRPLVIVAEDLHADDDSPDELQALSAELADAPILIVATARPELLVRRPGWGYGGERQLRIELPPLSRPEMEALVRSMLVTASLPDGLAEQVARESLGNPADLLELVAAYRESGVLSAEPAEGWRFDRGAGGAGSGRRPPDRRRRPHLMSLTPAEREVLARGCRSASGSGPAAWWRWVAWTPTRPTRRRSSRRIQPSRRFKRSWRVRAAAAFESATDASVPAETAWTFAVRSSCSSSKRASTPTCDAAASLRGPVAGEPGWGGARAAPRGPGATL